MESLLFSVLKMLSGSVMMKLMVAAVIGAVLYALGKAINHCWKMHQTFRDVPSHPNTHWLWGHAQLFFGDRNETVKHLVGCTKLYSKLHVVYLGSVNGMLFLHHPDTARIFFGSEPKLDLLYYPLMPWLGESLLTGSGQKWYRTRRLLTPAFHFDVLKPYVKVFSDCVDILLEKWSKVKHNDTVELFHSCSMLTLDVMLRCMCSYESDCQIAEERNPYIDAVNELTSLSLKRILFFPYYFDFIWYLTPHSRRFKKASDFVHKFAMDIISKRRNELEKKMSGVMKSSVARKNSAPPTKRRRYLDFIDVLLQAKDEDGIGLTNEEIRAEVDTFVFAGHDTTASGLSWTLYNLATYPEHQQKCREEVDALLEEKGSEDMEWDDLNKLEYISLCIKESLRLYPPVFAVGRKMSKDVTFDGHVMPAGTNVVFQIYPLHHHPEVWGDDVEEFNPLRFTPENSKDRDPFAYLPFAAGTRNCIGQNFAINEEKVAIAKILHRFELIPAVKGEVPRKELEIVLRAKDGIYLKLIPRNFPQ